MRNIITYKNIKFKKSDNHFMLIRGFLKDSDYSASYHDSYEFKADDWQEFSVNLHNVLSEGLEEMYVPSITRNLLGGEDCAYNEMFSLLMHYRDKAQLGILPTDNKSQIKKKLSQLTDKDYKSLAIAGYTLNVIKNILKYKDSDEIYYIRRNNSASRFPDTFGNVRDLINSQVIITGKYDASDAILLHGDAQVEKFIDEKGASLLKKIKFKTNDQTLEKYNYLNGFINQVYKELETCYQFKGAREALLGMYNNKNQAVYKKYQKQTCHPITPVKN